MLYKFGFNPRLKHLGSVLGGKPKKFDLQNLTDNSPFLPPTPPQSAFGVNNLLEPSLLLFCGPGIITTFRCNFYQSSINDNNSQKPAHSRKKGMFIYSRKIVLFSSLISVGKFIIFRSIQVLRVDDWSPNLFWSKTPQKARFDQNMADMALSITLGPGPQ